MNEYAHEFDAGAHDTVDPEQYKNAVHCHTKSWKWLEERMVELVDQDDSGQMIGDKTAEELVKIYLKDLGWAETYAINMEDHFRGFRKDLIDGDEDANELALDHFRKIWEDQLSPVLNGDNYAELAKRIVAVVTPPGSESERKGEKEAVRKLMRDQARTHLKNYVDCLLAADPPQLSTPRQQAGIKREREEAKVKREEDRESD